MEEIAGLGGMRWRHIKRVPVMCDVFPIISGACVSKSCNREVASSSPSLDIDDDFEPSAKRPKGACARASGA